VDWDIGDIFWSGWGIGRRVGEARVIGGGIEATIKGDEFAGMLHADEHFSASFVVVGGGGQDVFDVTGIGTFV